jgi:hypothetical protein
LLGKVSEETDYPKVSKTWLDTMLFGKIAEGITRNMGVPDEARFVNLMKILTIEQDWLDALPKGSGSVRGRAILREWFNNPDVQNWVKVNRFGGTLWFNQEGLEELLWWLFLIAVISSFVEEAQPSKSRELTEETSQSAAGITKIQNAWEVLKVIYEAEQNSGYQVDRLLGIAEAP